MMTLKSKPAQADQVLVVPCGCPLSQEAERAARAHMCAGDVQDAAQMLAQSTFDCVIACVDPAQKDSIVQLVDLRTAAKPLNIPIVTISQFNPSWIENLVVQFGAFAHFRHFPDKSQIASITDIHARVSAARTDEAEQ